MNHLKKLTASVFCAGLAAAATVGVAADANAAARAETTVTIKAENTDLSGVVRSPKPRRCAKDRTVILMKQIGTRGGGNDKRIATDVTDFQGGVYAWSTGNTGIEGRFYAKVKRTALCKGDTSRTVRATRSN